MLGPLSTHPPARLRREFHPQEKRPAGRTLKSRKIPAPELTAKNYIARLAKPSVVPGHVKLAFTLDLPRELAERLNARAIREGRNLEAVVLGVLNGEATGRR